MAKHLPKAPYAYANDSQSYFSFKPWPLWLLGKISKWLRNVLQRFAFGWSLIGYQLMTRRLNILSSPLTGSVSIESIAGGTCVSVISGCMVWKSYVYACTHVVKVCSKALRGLHTIRHIGKFLAEESTKSLVHAFVTSHLDYCNSLLYGIYLNINATVYRGSSMLLLGWFVLYRSLTISLLLQLNCTGYLSIFEFSWRFFYSFWRR